MVACSAHADPPNYFSFSIQDQDIGVFPLKIIHNYRRIPVALSALPELNLAREFHSLTAYHGSEIRKAALPDLLSSAEAAAVYRHHRMQLSNDKFAY
jgi:hypothetical protein